MGRFTFVLHLVTSLLKIKKGIRKWGLDESFSDLGLDCLRLKTQSLISPPTF